LTRATLGWVSTAVLVRVVSNLAARHLGFEAVSDDDYARVVIAQQFSHLPAWDPSGTSWLPFPFWLTGLTMCVFGTELEVARSLAWVTSLSSVSLFYLASRWCGQSERAAGWTACAFATFPHAVWLGLATVPEGYAAVLASVALASCNRPRRIERVVGISCVIAASLCRYELWPVAVVVAIAQHLAPALPATTVATRSFASFAALSGAFAWLLHGITHHGNAWFFLTRVKNYRTLVGQAAEHWLDVISNYPLALVTAAPELVLFVLTVLVVASLSRDRALVLACVWRNTKYPLLGAAAVVLFLMVGDANNGAPTHHPERALQVCWLATLLAVGVGLQQTRILSSTRLRWATYAIVPALALGLVRTQAQAFVKREAEVALGRTFAHELDASNRLLVETHGYGHLAVAAGTGQPWHVVGMNPNDPRQNTSIWSSDEGLRSFLARERIRWLVVPQERREVVEPAATVVTTSDLGLTLHVQ
jgi:hypothetical protein